MILVIGEDGNEAYLVQCVNLAHCQSAPFLSDKDFTPSIRVEGVRKPLCRVCAERLYAMREESGMPVPDVDWVRAYPTWTEIVGEE